MNPEVLRLIEQCVQLPVCYDPFGKPGCSDHKTITTLYSNFSQSLGGNQGPSRANFTNLNHQVTHISVDT